MNLFDEVTDIETESPEHAFGWNLLQKAVKAAYKRQDIYMD
jgi:hypothetical protein